ARAGVAGGALDGRDKFGVESTRACAAFLAARDQVFKCGVGDREFQSLALKFVLKWRQYVLDEDAAQGLARKRREGDDAREAADQFGQETKLLKRADFIKRQGRSLRGRAAKTDQGAALAQDFVETGERAASDEGDVARRNFGALAEGREAVVHRHGDDGAFKHRQQLALHAVARHVFGRPLSGKARAAAGRSELVKFIETDDAALGDVRVIAGGCN